MNLEDTANALSNLISKFIGKNNWIFLLAVAAACFAGIYYYDVYGNTWWLISILVLSLSIIILNILTYIVTKSYNSISNFFNHKSELRKSEKEKKKNLELAQIREAKKQEELADNVWTLVEFTPKDTIQDALLILNLPLSNNNPYRRFLKAPTCGYGEEYDNYQHIYKAISHFSYHDNRVRLLRQIHHNNGCFIEIDQYLFKLLDNYTKNGKWEKVKP